MNNHELIVEVLKRQASGNLKGMLELMTDDVAFELPFFGDRYVGKVEIEARMAPSVARMQGLAFRDFVLRDMAEPGWVLANFKGTARCTTTGRTYNQIYIAVFQVRDGRVALFQEYFDTFQLFQTIGRAELVQ